LCSHEVTVADHARGAGVKSAVVVGVAVVAKLGVGDVEGGDGGDYLQCPAPPRSWVVMVSRRCWRGAAAVVGGVGKLKNDT
jgi:hypothetical protein